MIRIVPFEPSLQADVLVFLEKCMPESKREFQPQGRHAAYTNIGQSMDRCWCLMDGDQVVGTSAVKRINSRECELKMLYIYKTYYGNGYGRQLLDLVLERAREMGCERIYLDTTTWSTRAVRLYKSYGFTPTERYNDNDFADLFMEKELK